MNTPGCAWLSCVNISNATSVQQRLPPKYTMLGAGLANVSMILNTVCQSVSGATGESTIIPDGLANVVIWHNVCNFESHLGLNVATGQLPTINEVSMIQQTVDSHIHYKHSPDEVAQLAKAVVPMRDSILAVSAPWERAKMKMILRGDYFRRADALHMKNMLLRAVKHSRANLSDYFVILRQQILKDSQDLEDSAKEYWREFSKESAQKIPTP